MSTKKIGVGERLRQTRNAMSLNQEDFARIVGSSKSSISGYENEDVPIPSDILLNICRECKVSADWLIKGEVPTILKDEKEKELIDSYREMQKLNPRVAEKYKRYGDYELKEIKKETKSIFTHKGKTLTHKKG